jgi:hypothetical protein
MTASGVVPQIHGVEKFFGCGRAAHGRIALIGELA